MSSRGNNVSRQRGSPGSAGKANHKMRSFKLLAQIYKEIWGPAPLDEFADYEIPLFFKPHELLEYEFADEHWLYGKNE